MSFWGFIFSFIFSVVVNTLFAPKPKVENARKAGLGDFSFPTASNGRPVPILWGTVMQSGPNLIWYGDKSEVPIKERVKSGLFSSTTIIKGYAYNLGIQYGLCYGDGVALKRIRINEEDVWTGNLTLDGDTGTITDLDLFGGNDLGQGGMDGTFAFYTGSDTQTIDSYLAPFQVEGGQSPGYRYYSYVSWRGGYVGNSENMPTWSFEIERIPDPLAVGAQATVNSKDANPAFVLYELYTNQDYGRSLPAGDMDETSFTDAATTLYNEGNGFSFLLDSTTDLDELIDEIERQIDGVVVLDRSTGKWTLNLIRGGYNINTVPELTDDNVNEVMEFARGAWNETTNEVRLNFNNRENEYQSDYAFAQDMANQRIQGVTVSSAPVSYPGVKDSTLANNLVWRDLVALSRPLARAELSVNREFWNVNRGDILAFTNTSLGIDKLPMRVVEANLGDINEDEITLNLIEDAFANTTGVFTAPGATAWVPPSTAVVDIPLADRAIFEAPKAFIDRDPDNPGVPNRIWAGFQSQDKSEVFFSLTVGGVEVGNVVGYLYAGTIRTAVDAADHGGNIEVDGEPDTYDEILAILEDATDSDIGVSLANLILINGEFIAFKTFTDQTTWVRLDDCYRGLLDSAPTPHAVDDKVFFLFVSGGITTDTFLTTPISVKPLPENSSGQLALGSSTTSSVVMESRHLKPYPPAQIEVNSTVFPSGNVDLADDVSAGDDGSGIDLEYVRRDYRTADEVAAVTDESSLPTDFPTVNNTRYEVELRNDPDGANTLLLTSAFATTAQRLFSRTEILRETVGVVPTRMRLAINTRHTVDSVDHDADAYNFDFDTEDTDLDSSDNLGLMDDNDVEEPWSSAPDTGDYTFTIGSDILTTGDVEARINGGSWNTIISTGSTTGNLTGVTATDQIEFRHTQSGAGTSHTLITIDPPSTADKKHAILII